MFNFILTGIAIVGVTVVELLRKQRWYIKLIFVLVCAAGITGAYRAYQDNHDLTDKLSKLQASSDTIKNTQQLQLTGALEAIWGTPTMTQAGTYERTDKFRSRYVQDMQDIHITLQFDGKFEHVHIAQGFPSGLQIHTCSDVDTAIIADLITYKCDYLPKGEWIEIITHSKVPMQIVSYDLSPK